MEEVKILGNENGILKVALCGDIDSNNAESFFRTVTEAYLQNPANVEFDCAELDFIDSTTLGTFVKILKSVKTNGHKVALKNLQSNIKKLFLSCSLDTIMEIA